MLRDLYRRCRQYRTFWWLALAFYVFIVVTAILRLVEGVEWTLAVFMVLYLLAGVAGAIRSTEALAVLGRESAVDRERDRAPS